MVKKLPPPETRDTLCVVPRNKYLPKPPKEIVSTSNTGYKERKRLTPEALGGSRLLQSIDIETDDRRPPTQPTTVSHSHAPPAPPPAVRIGEGSQPRAPLRRTPAASPSMRDGALRWDVPPPLTVVGFAEAESRLDTAKAQARARAVLTAAAAPHLEALARQLLVGRGVADVDTYVFFGYIFACLFYYRHAPLICAFGYKSPLVLNIDQHWC